MANAIESRLTDHHGVRGYADGVAEAVAGQAFGVAEFGEQ